MLLTRPLVGSSSTLVQEDPSPLLEHWPLVVMTASAKDHPDTIRFSPVLGFVYVGDVDKERRRMKILAPVSGRLGDRPLIRGKWPEALIGLLG